MLIVVLTTVASATDAETLAGKLVDSGLAACVQILPLMTSVYRWEGKLQTESEHLLLIKTLDERYDDLELFLSENHPYEVPEIVALDAHRVSQSYLDFAARSTAKD